MDSRTAQPAWLDGRFYKLDKAGEVVEALLSYLGFPEHQMDKTEFRSTDPSPATVKRVVAELRKRAAAARQAEEAVH